MSGRWKEVARLTFRGPRYDQRALDLAALGKLATFQRLISETAKALWRANNPDRARLPQHFEKRVGICLRTICDGSTVAPLEVLVDESEHGILPGAETPEIDGAVDLAQEVFDAVEREAPLPERLPRSLIADYAKFGEELSPENSFEFCRPGKAPSRVKPEHGRRLLGFQDAPHETRVEMIGEVLEADVRQKRFQLWTDDGNKVPVNFADEHETQVTTALKEHRSVRIRVKGIGEVSSSGRTTMIRQVEELAIQPVGEVAYDRSARPIEDVLAEIAAGVDEAEWQKVPTDLSEHHDRYLYGTKEQS
jgi:hypothetical protein